jgi:hypothetical protein
VTASVSVRFVCAQPRLAENHGVVPKWNVVLGALVGAARAIEGAAHVHVGIRAILIVAIDFSRIHTILVKLWAIVHSASTFLVSACLAVVQSTCGIRTMNVRSIGL